MVLFAFTTLIGNLYYVNQAFSHILGHAPGKKFNYVYYVLASALTLIWPANAIAFLPRMSQ